jgi:hypothetical protein
MLTPTFKSDLEADWGYFLGLSKTTPPDGM